ncbi:MAG: fused MFS/spermidine synthase, partial [Verrucomicrobiae bacterium]|nr:fused MFS/spermidine synthase [Verrucomicrobiae bacterium]
MKNSGQKRPAEGLSPGLRLYMFVTAAVTGAAIMIVEILGAKMLAPYFGTSHFVWTAQIAVTLVALACGYAVGGLLADRSPRPALVYGAIMLAAGWLALAVIACESVAYWCLRFRLGVGSLMAATALFFVPLALLAMVGPFFVRVIANTVTHVGSVVGKLTALGTVGSVIGTILIGYVLIPFLPNSTTMGLTAAVLVVVGAVFFVVWGHRTRAPGVAGCTVTLVMAGLSALQQPAIGTVGMKEVLRANSNFGLLQVIETDSGARRWFLNDLLTQNTYAPETGQSMSLFTYLLHGLAAAYTPGMTNALCIGLGVGIVPMQFAREGVRVDVVEINPAVIPIATRFFAFDPTKVSLHIGDGRYYFAVCAARYDTIILDAFLGESPPSHLMTREAFEAMRRCLNPGGTLVMNTFVDLSPGRDFLGASILKTLRQVFKSVAVHDALNGNVFYVASDQDPLVPHRVPLLDHVPEQLRYAVDMAFRNRVFVDEQRGIVLTDDYNPADFFDARNREALR